MKMLSVTLAAMASIGALAIPAVSHAGNVGYTAPGSAAVRLPPSLAPVTPRLSSPPRSLPSTPSSSIAAWATTLTPTLTVLGQCTASNACAGMQTYLTNVIDWSVKQAKSCAKEGYKGAQLTWCQNIYENGLTGQVLDTWIHRWVNRYRKLPYCAAE